jgi:RNA polymerase sigma-70 factor (ECF subfamily)
MADTSGSSALPPEAELLTRLRSGDEATFAAVLDAWSRGMMRAARAYVASDEAAQDVVQETWLAVIRGLDQFEGRSSLRTWAYRILVNIARTQGAKDSRTIAWSSLMPDGVGPTVDPGRFRGPHDPYPGHWQQPPATWPSPESEVVSREIRRTIEAALVDLPHAHRVVITLRDMDGYSAEEVCTILQIGAANQRVLLHRARAAVRARIEEYFAAALSTEEARI